MKRLKCTKTIQLNTNFYKSRINLGSALNNEKLMKVLKSMNIEFMKIKNFKSLINRKNYLEG